MSTFGAIALTLAVYSGGLLRGARSEIALTLETRCKMIMAVLDAEGDIQFGPKRIHEGPLRKYASQLDLANGKVVVRALWKTGGREQEFFAQGETCTTQKSFLFVDEARRTSDKFTHSWNIVLARRSQGRVAFGVRRTPLLRPPKGAWAPAFAVPVFRGILVPVSDGWRGDFQKLAAR